MQQQTKPFVVFVLGGPGAGKGTQCGLLSKHYNFIHLSAGDLLRNASNSKIKSGSDKGEMIKKYIDEGKIVPVEVTVNLIKDAMIENGWEKSRFLVDGFPRNQDNVDGWNKVIGEDANLHGVLFFDCSEETLEKRIKKRASESTEQRSDDNPEALKKRLVTYREQTKPIIEHFTKLNKVNTIDCEGDVDQVFAKLEEIFSFLKQ